MSRIEYDPLFSFLHESSPRVSPEDYERMVPKVDLEDLDRIQREEYGRLMEEIEFLVRFWDPEEIEEPVLVVEGASPVSHYSILSVLFPTLKIELWTQNAGETPKQVRSNERITVHPDSLSENDALRLYRNKKVFFICYLDREEIAVDDLARQTNLERAINSKASNLTFTVPVDNYSYFKGYILPRVFGSKERSLEDGIYRLVPILDGKSRIKCNYSLKWFEESSNYWNSIAKKGNLLINPFTKSLQFETRRGTAHCGVEICRVLDICVQYVEFSGLDSTVPSLVDFLESKLEELNVSYTLSEHSKKYSPEGIFAQEERVRKLDFPPTIDQARFLLESGDMTLTDLNL